MKSRTCAQCSEIISSVSSTCRFCGEMFCINHHLPDRHGCTGLAKSRESQLSSLEKNGEGKPIENFLQGTERKSFQEKWRKPHFRILYYIVLVAITLLAIFAISRILI